MGLLLEFIFDAIAGAIASKLYEERRWLALSLFCGLPLLLIAALFVLAFWARS